jgi:hypothetical protein
VYYPLGPLKGVAWLQTTKSLVRLAHQLKIQIPNCNIPTTQLKTEFFF